MIEISKQNNLEVRVFKKGDSILKEGEANTNVFVLKEGAVAINIAGEEICRICTPQAIFGEVSALLHMETSATVEAVEDATLWVIDDFRSFILNNPAYALTIAEELARRLSNMSLNFIEARSALKELEDANKKPDDDRKKIVIDKRTVDQIKAHRQEQKQRAKTQVSNALKKVDKILHIRMDS